MDFGCSCPDFLFFQPIDISRPLQDYAMAKKGSELAVEDLPLLMQPSYRRLGAWFFCAALRSEEGEDAEYDDWNDYLEEPGWAWHCRTSPFWDHEW